jgi:GT2 family glycosyltransferase
VISNKTHVVVGFVHPLQVCALFSRSLVDVVRKYDYAISSVMSGPNVSRARNTVVTNFLEYHKGIDWLFMVDTDMVFHEDAILGLLSCNEPLVSALCLTGGEKPVASMYRQVKEGPDKGMYLSISEWPTDHVIDADVVGSACTLIHRSVFEDIREKLPNPAAQWYQELQKGDILLGEDFTFCERATEVGYKVKVNTAVQVGHVKGSMLGNVK